MEPHVISILIYFVLINNHIFSKIDLSKPWIDQGPVDVIIHKVTDFIAAANGGDLQAFKAIQKIEVQ